MLSLDTNRLALSFILDFMSRFTIELWDLAGELFGPEELARMRLVVQSCPLSFDQLLALDEMLGGASMSQVTQNGTGQYHLDDREVFRPLQYCAMYFYRKEMGEVEWFARDIVQMSGLHIECLLNRLGQFFGFTLGRALNDKRIRNRIGPIVWAQADRFRGVYNAAKHEVDHDKDTHLFSVEDAVLAYFGSRKLGESLYPLAKLRTRFPLSRPVGGKV